MISQLFTWWNSTTFGTSFTLWRRGAKKVGEDEQGNRYFEETTPSRSDGSTRRWVIYHGVAEASRVPPDWHGWLHHTFEAPPTDEPFMTKSWEKAHLPNMTGTPLAYHPKGSLSVAGGASAVKAGYDAWSPDNEAERAEETV